MKKIIFIIGLCISYTLQAIILEARRYLIDTKQICFLINMEETMPFLLFSRVDQNEKTKKIEKKVAYINTKAIIDSQENIIKKAFNKVSRIADCYVENSSQKNSLLSTLKDIKTTPENEEKSYTNIATLVELERVLTALNESNYSFNVNSDLYSTPENGNFTVEDLLNGEFKDYQNTIKDKKLNDIYREEMKALNNDSLKDFSNLLSKNNTNIDSINSILENKKFMTALKIIVNTMQAKALAKSIENFLQSKKKELIVVANALSIFNNIDNTFNQSNELKAEKAVKYVPHEFPLIPASREMDYITFLKDVLTPVNIDDIKNEIENTNSHEVANSHFFKTDPIITYKVLTNDLRNKLLYNLSVGQKSALYNKLPSLLKNDLYNRLSMWEKIKLTFWRNLVPATAIGITAIGVYKYLQKKQIGMNTVIEWIKKQEKSMKE